ncbi:MAG: hypothetical protein ACR2JB_05390 [Bryobacteraceae bacterium]
MPPKHTREAETFAQLVKDKGRSLRVIPYERLELLGDQPAEEIVFGRRKGRISVIVERCNEERVKVVVQRFLDGSWFARLKHVALDGFYKCRDGSVVEMRNEECYGYD